METTVLRQDEYVGYLVSTVKLNQDWNDDYETAVFPSREDMDEIVVRRSTTIDEAMEEHDVLLEMLSEHGHVMSQIEQEVISE
jgi:hypothetical protein